MAMACLRLLTFLPLLPLLSVPRLRLRMLRSTSLEALREYRRAMVIPFLAGETTSLSQLACGEAEWKNIKHPRIVPACEDNSHCAYMLASELSDYIHAVMPGLGPGIHVFRAATKTWMAGTSPAMTSYASTQHD